MDYSKYFPQEFKKDEEPEKIELDQFEGKAKVFAEERLLQAEEKEKEKYRVQMDRFYTPTYRQELSRQLAKEVEGNPLRYIFVPKAVMHGFLEDSKLMSLRISIFIYLLAHSGCVSDVKFSVKRFAVEWMGKTGNSSLVSLNNDILQVFYSLYNMGFIKYRPDVFSGSKFDYIVNLNKNKIQMVCGNENSRFAIFYEDELQKIMGGSKRPYRALAVYAYIKFQVYYREVSKDNSETMMNQYAEVCESTYKNMKHILHMSDHIFNGILDELVELDLIRYIPPIRISYIGKKDGKLHHYTMKAIFCLYDRRRNGRIIESGEDYWLRELVGGLSKYGQRGVMTTYLNKTGLTLMEVINGNMKKEYVEVGELKNNGNGFI